MSPEKILFVGPSAGGKDTVANRIALLTGAEVISTSSQVRKSAKEFGLENPTRGELQQFANSMREQYGEDIFAKLTSEENHNKKNQLVIVNGIRNPSEIKFFKNALIIGVDASKEKRFKRTLERNGPSDPKNWEDFLICDARENGTSNGIKGQQNYQCLSMADVIIKNEGNTFEGLEHTVDLLVDQLLTSPIDIRKTKLFTPTDIDIDSSDKKILIITNGIHGSGKTTISLELSQDIRGKYIYEIGGQLRQEVSYNVLQSTVDFDREVMRRELLRDHQLLRDPDIKKCILETWHTGNIAYILKRSPSLAPVYLEEFKKQLSKFSLVHVLLNINKPTFLNRMSEKVSNNEREDLFHFYQEIANHTRSLYSKFNLNFKEIDNNQKLSTTKKETINFIRPYIN